MVVIDPGETYQCQQIPVINDGVFETPAEEVFVVSITSISPEMVDLGENSSTYSMMTVS